MSSIVPWTNPGGAPCCCITCGPFSNAISQGIEIEYEDFVSIYSGGTFTLEFEYQASIGGSFSAYGGSASLSGSAKHRVTILIVNPSTNQCQPQLTASNETVFTNFVNQWDRPTISPDGSAATPGWVTPAESLNVPEVPSESKITGLQRFVTLNNTTGKNLFRGGINVSTIVFGGNSFSWNFFGAEYSAYLNITLVVSISMFASGTNTTIPLHCPNNTYQIPATIYTSWSRQIGAVNGEGESFENSPLVILDPPPIMTYTPAAP